MKFFLEEFAFSPRACLVIIWNRDISPKLSKIVAPSSVFPDGICAS